jgi:hypothetical protein
MAITKIVSGGQTGVDRGALDAALAAGFSCGGWCPADRRAEDGPIPQRYPLTPLPGAFATRKWQRTQVREASRSRAADSSVPGEGMDVRTARPVGEQYRQRTQQNLIDSDGTAILYYETLKGGTRLTRNLCALEKRPYILIDARQVTEPGVAAVAIVKFVEEKGIQTLNVGGPTLSGWSQGYAFALGAVGKLIGGNK